MNLDELLKSKKFKVMLVSVVGVVLMSIASDGVLTEDAINDVVNIVLVYLGAQGIADLGKGLNGKSG